MPLFFPWILAAGRVQIAGAIGCVSAKCGDAASGHRDPLLCLRAVGDNAAMQTEPIKADPPKRKHRWIQFRLRTLMNFTIRPAGRAQERLAQELPR
jgi:hypothetical protein